MTTKSRVPTRDRLLDAAEELINTRGFAATSIEQILECVGVIKGIFFYHFKSKDQLARALIERFARADQHVLLSNMQRAEALSDDPRQQLFVFVGLLVELAEGLDTNAQPGCLFATYCWEGGLFDDDTQSVIRDAMGNWRAVLVAKLEQVAALHPPRVEVDLESLADMITVAFEGAFVVARTLESPGTIAAQIRHYRTYLQLLFADQ